MHLTQQIEPHIHADSAADTVTLDYESRFLRRKRLVTDNGEAFLVELAETCSIDEGQGFRLDDGRVIAVHAAAEQLLKVRHDNLVRIAWHGQHQGVSANGSTGLHWESSHCKVTRGGRATSID